MSDVLIKRRNLDTAMYTARMPCEEEGRDRSHVSESQGIPKTIGKSPEARIFLLL